jgi:zinc protease
VIVVVESSFALPLVSIAITFRAGSASDPVGKEGLARVTARMLRRGAGGLSANEVEEAIDVLGGELSSDVGVSWTAYGMDVIERNVDEFVSRAASVLGEPTFDKAELEKLLRESEGELIEARDNDRGLAGRAFRRGIFDGHLYGRRTAGTIASLRSITRSDVVDFYARHINRANAVVAISGHVTELRARELAEALVAKLPEGEATPDPVTEPPRKTGRRLFFVDKPERTQTQLYIGGMGTLPRDPDHVALHVSNTIFGGTFTARLMQEVRSKRGWSYGASSRLGVERHRESFSIWTAPAAADAAACLALELELFEAWVNDGVTNDELTFTKSYLTRSHVFDIDTAGKRVHQKADAKVLDLPDGYHERYLEHVAAVTKDAADRAVRERLSTTDLVIAVVGTYAELGAAIEAAIPNLASTTVLPHDFE